MPLGVSDTVGPIDEIRTQVELAVDGGYDAFWTQELIDTRDGMTTAAAIGAWNVDIDIVVGLPSPYVRHPALIVTELCSIDDIADGRVRGLSMGTNAPEILRKLDEPLDRPITAMSETCDIVKTLIKDGYCDFEGREFTLTNWKLRCEFQSETIPIYLAGMGPKMRELAAYKYDGLFLPFNSPAAFVETVAEDIADHLEAFDRDPDTFTLALNVPTAVLSPASDRTREEQLRAIVEFTAWHCSSDHIKPLITQAGIDYDIEALREAVRNNDYETIRSIVDDDFLDTVAVVGSAETCRDRYQEYRDAGLDYPVIYNYGPAEIKFRNVNALAPNGG